MTDVIWTRNFLGQARGLTFHDSASVTWTFNPNTNQLIATATATVVPTPADPTASIGATAVDGVAATFMRSDAAPPLGMNVVSNAIAAQMAADTFKGNPTGATANSQDMTVAQVKTLLNLSGTNTGDQTLPTGATPTAKVGSSAVVGSAATFMRSDAAPPVDLTATYTWTGLHTFGAPVVVNASATTTSFSAHGGSNNFAGAFFGSATSGQSFGLVVEAGTSASDIAFLITNATNTATFLSVNGVGAVTLAGPVGFNGATPPAQVTGFGAPTGASVLPNFPGASATLPQCSAAIAEILIILKSMGIIGA